MTLARGSRLILPVISHIDVMRMTFIFFILPNPKPQDKVSDKS